MSPADIDAWASAYIEYQQDPNNLDEHHPLFWAAERFMQPNHSASAEDCWLTILEILSRDPPDSVVGMLAAGPLEDLIEDAGAQFIERIELQARRDPAFRSLLCGVWESNTPEIWSRIEHARGSIG